MIVSTHWFWEESDFDVLGERRAVFQLDLNVVIGKVVDERAVLAQVELGLVHTLALAPHLQLQVLTIAQTHTWYGNICSVNFTF